LRLLSGMGKEKKKEKERKKRYIMVEAIKWYGWLL
jgi:hypothetical protein